VEINDHILSSEETAVDTGWVWRIAPDEYDKRK
jgi:hypothetical protein